MCMCVCVWWRCVQKKYNVVNGVCGEMCELILIILVTTTHTYIHTHYCHGIIIMFAQVGSWFGSLLPWLHTGTHNTHTATQAH